ncbi:hypothetical protein SEUCBS139899_003569 [Sporothrix eucalyptigena]|uniref:Uncharacterized protein n=1 Tax=Sporothrix eucalyptigena TaxID=1812306 RepID=A0ABP0B628_9PEZI
MDPQSPRDASSADDAASQRQQHIPPARRQSSSQGSQASDDSHTAMDFIRSQMQLEADAREALPFSIEHCGCGEDWWHPGCVVGMGPKWFEKSDDTDESKDSAGRGQKNEEATVAAVPDALPTISEDAEEEHGVGVQGVNGGARQNGSSDAGGAEEEDEPPMPPRFPKEDDFEGFICYKCVDAYPWIRQYAGAPGFLPAVFYDDETDLSSTQPIDVIGEASKKRKAVDDTETDAKRARPDEMAGPNGGSQNALEPKDRNEGLVSAVPQASSALATASCKRAALPPPPNGRFSLFFTEEFRNNLCRCADCFLLLTPHPQLLEQEETYEPPISEEGGSDDEAGGAGSGSHGSGSLYERGESALRNVDRVRAIEGVMAYNHLKDKLKPFFQQFAESGQAISAEDIKSYFAKLRGDEQAIREAGEAAKSNDNRREQSGY